MASITFCFPKKKKKKECECVCTHTVVHFHDAASSSSKYFKPWSCQVTVGKSKCLHNRIVPLSWSGAWKRHKATDHQLRSCPNNCSWFGFCCCCCCFFFPLLFPLPTPFLSLSELQPICKCSLPQGQIWKSEEQHNLSKCGRKWRNQAPC